MPRYLNQQSVSRSSGQESHGVLVGTVFKRLVAGPQVGATPDGVFAPDLEAQVDLAFDNVLTLIGSAGLEARDLVRLTVYTKVPGSAALCQRRRDLKIAPARPAYAYREVAGFAHPACLVEVEIEALRES